MAAVQIALASTGPLSPWKGGGFGMFASLDGGRHRFSRAVVTAGGRQEELAIPSDLRNEARKVEIYPTDARLDRLAREILRSEALRGRVVTQARIEVWRVEFAARSLDPTLRLLNARTVASPAREPG